MRWWQVILITISGVLTIEDGSATTGSRSNDERQIILNGEQYFKVEQGDSVIVPLARESGVFEGCYITIPSGDTLPISESTSYLGIAWYGRPTSETICTVELTINSNDRYGKWTVFAWFNNNGIRTEARQPVNIDPYDGITTLPLLEYLTNVGSVIEISLNETGVSGECRLRPPFGDEFALSEAIESSGVTPKASNKYVACRATIGPLTNEMLGQWTLIHKNDKIREQPVIIAWANPSHPEEEAWEVATLLQQNLITNLGTIVNLSTARSNGFVRECFLTTPDGATFPVYNRLYPGIKFYRENSVSACIVELGPLESDMLGKWVLTASHDNFGELIKIEQPINIALDDGITTLPLLRHFTNIGAYVDININEVGISGSCSLRIPSGSELVLGSTTIPGVNVQESSKFVSCRVTIGPMSESLLGEWSLIHQETNGRRRLQSATIAWANPARPEADARQLIIAPETKAATELGDTLTFSAGREEGVFEGCFLTTPDRTVIPVFSNIQYPGITHIVGNRYTGCFVQLGPIDSDMLGHFILAARFNRGGIRVERQQPITIIEDDGIITLPTIIQLTHMNANVDINLNHTGTVGTCYLRDPAGEEHNLNSINLSGVTVQSINKFISCGVTIGPLSNSLLGTWVLIETMADKKKRKQPIIIEWANPLNPNIQSREIKTAPEQTSISRFFDTVIVSTPWENGLFESCFLTTPDGIILPITADTRYPGITFQRANSIWSCRAELGPIVNDIIGEWTLAANFNNDGSLLETRQTINVVKNVEFDTELPLLEHFTYIGGHVELNLNNTDNSMKTCRLLTPEHEIFTLDSEFNVPGVTIKETTKFVSCRIIIGPITAKLLGTWTLVEENEDETQRHQSITISFANLINPYIEPELIRSTTQNIETTLGKTVTVSIGREDGLSEGCLIITPNGEELPVFPHTRYPGVTHAGTNRFTTCFVNLGPVDTEMVGRWTLIARYNNGGLRVHLQRPINLAIGDGTTTLTNIEHLTNLGAFIDINLNQTAEVGICRLINPTGQEITLGTSTMLGVTVHSSSKFVSCRVTIGPMTESLLGKWTLIQENTDGTQRHQPATIAWANPLNPSREVREIVIADEQKMMARIGTVVSTYISRETGLSEGCYLTAPDGTLLPMFENTKYPGAMWTGTNSVTACSVQLGPFDAEMAGKWILAARFNNNGVRTEMQQPINIVFSDLSDIIITTLPRVDHLVNIGSIVDISLNQTGLDGTCRLKTPDGHDYILGRNINLSDVTVQSSSKFVSCRVTIGPIREALLGEWTLIHEETEQSERQQPVLITWANSHEPEKEARHVIIAAQQNNHVDSGSTITISIGREDGLSERCFLTTPNGEVLPMFPTSQYPGITYAGANRITSCFIELGPIDSDMLGRWVLAARYNDGGHRVESQQPINLIIGDGTTTLPRLEYLTHINDLVDFNLNQTENAGTCRLRSPVGQEIVLGSGAMSGVTVHHSNKFVSCRVTIGPMTENLLGEWTMIQQFTNGNERIQTASLFWADPADPTSPREIVVEAEKNTIIGADTIVSTYMSREDGRFEGCFITTPDGSTLPVFPSTRYPGVVWTGVNRFTACFVQIGPLDADMSGKWILAARYDNNGPRSETQQIINFVFSDSSHLTTTTLPRLDYITNVGDIIDINLSQTGVDGTCRIKTPDGIEYILEGNVNLQGVTVHSKSKFVSCRVTIGPLTEDLLGKWTLTHQDSDVTQREQPVLIAWANPQNPTEDARQLQISAQENKEFDTGDTISVSMSRLEGFFEGCFLTTPSGEVLPVFPHSNYTGVTHAGANRFTACFIDLGPMSIDMAGRWILASRFNNGGQRVESRLPLNLVLGDGTITLTSQEHVTYIGAFVDLSLNQTGKDRNCRVRTPTGQELSDSSNALGITIHHIGNMFISCRVTIGPMTEELLGEWILLEEYPNHTQRLQPATIAWANPSNPAQQRNIITIYEQNNYVTLGETTRVSIAREDGLFEGCYMITPDGAVLPVLSNSVDYPGITHAGVNRFTACFIDLGPMVSEMVGRWILTARYNNNGERTEWQLPINLDIGNQHSKNTALIVAICVICSVLIMITAVLVFRKSRQWSTQQFSKLRSSFRSTSSKADLITSNHKHEMNQSKVTISGIEPPQNNNNSKNV